MALNGTARADRFAARFDLDKVYGLAGNDTLTSTNWNDTYLDGGDGNDRLSSVFYLWHWPDDWTDRLVATQKGGKGDDTLDLTVQGAGSFDLYVRGNLDGGDGNDTITATFTGSTGAYFAAVTTWGGKGNDILRVVETADSFYASLRSTIYGGEGDDDIRIDTSGNVPHVTNVIQGDAGHDRIFAEALGFHHDGVTEATAENRISGGNGNDWIEAIALGANEWVSVGTNTVSGDAGNDAIRGEAAHANILSGGVGNDNIRATLTETYTSYSFNPRNDLDGGDGNDVLWATGLAEVWDWDDWQEGPSVLTNRLVGGNGNDTLWASGSFLTNYLPGSGSVRNEMLGGAGNDTIYAEVAEESVGVNRIYGHDGDDRLQSVGGDGNLLHGGKGRDVLIGGAGGDTFTGDAGADTFVFGTGPGGRDVVTDFMADDRIAIVGLVDRGARGLYDDFLAAVDSVTQARAGAPVELAFDDGARIAITAVGIGGVIDEVTDFIRASQLVSADPFGL